MGQERPIAGSKDSSLGQKSRCHYFLCRGLRVRAVYWSGVGTRPLQVEGGGTLPLRHSSQGATLAPQPPKSCSLNTRRQPAPHRPPTQNILWFGSGVWFRGLIPGISWFGFGAWFRGLVTRGSWFGSGVWFRVWVVEGERPDAPYPQAPPRAQALSESPSPPPTPPPPSRTLHLL